MSKIEIYKCDRCKSESLDQNELDLAVVAIGVAKYSHNSYGPAMFFTQDDLNRKMDLCITCRKELGIDYNRKVVPAPEVKYPTLEDLIREYIREEIGNR